MDKISEFIPIIIGIIIFVAKMVSDANKKQQQTQTKTSASSVKRSSNQYGQNIETGKQNTDYSWEQTRTDENEYRSLDPAFVPKEIPDIDYDKMTNVSVEASKDSSSQSTLGGIIRTESRKLRDIRKLFKEKNSLQELMLLSEVLNKPKAHRQWQRNLH